MLIVGYCFGIRSERRLFQEVHLNLAYRWFCRLGLDGDVPDHSTFSKTRHGRFRESDLLRELFETVLRRCMTEGLIGGEGFAVDASLIVADVQRQRDAAKREELPQARRAVAEYLAVLDDAAFGGATTVPPKHLSPADPAARWTASWGGPVVYAYCTNYLIDVEHAVIVDVEPSTAVRQAEVTAARTMLDRTHDRFDLWPERLIADTGYGSAEMLNWLVHERGIEPHIPVYDKSKRKDGIFSRGDFTYDHATDTYRCPAGKTLMTTGNVGDSSELRYRASKYDCDVCPLKPRCCPRRLRGVQVSAGGVRGVWQRHGLLTRHERILRLEKATAERRIELTDEQIRLLERFSPEFRERHIEAPHTGALVAVDTFFVGVLKGVGRVYLQTAIDCHSRYAWARQNTSKPPITAVHLMNNDVLSSFEAAGARIAAVISDNGRTFCGRPDRHPYELFLQLEEIEHRTTRVKRPQLSGIVERLHRTLLDEHFRVEGRRTWFDTVEEMQAVLDRYLEGYNHKRPHQGRGMQGRTPAKSFKDGLPKNPHSNEVTAADPSPNIKLPDPGVGRTVRRLPSLYRRRRRRSGVTAKKSILFHCVK